MVLVYQAQFTELYDLKLDCVDEDINTPVQFCYLVRGGLASAISLVVGSA